MTHLPPIDETRASAIPSPEPNATEPVPEEVGPPAESRRLREELRNAKARHGGLLSRVQPFWMVQGFEGDGPPELDEPAQRMLDAHLEPISRLSEEDQVEAILGIAAHRGTGPVALALAYALRPRDLELIERVREAATGNRVYKGKLHDWDDPVAKGYRDLEDREVRSMRPVVLGLREAIRAGTFERFDPDARGGSTIEGLFEEQAVPVFKTTHIRDAERNGLLALLITEIIQAVGTSMAADRRAGLGPGRYRYAFDPSAGLDKWVRKRKGRELARSIDNPPAGTSIWMETIRLVPPGEKAPRGTRIVELPPEARAVAYVACHLERVLGDLRDPEGSAEGAVSGEDRPWWRFGFGGGEDPKPAAPVRYPDEGYARHLVAALDAATPEGYTEPIQKLRNGFGTATEMYMVALDFLWSNGAVETREEAVDLLSDSYPFFAQHASLALRQFKEHRHGRMIQPGRRYALRPGYARVDEFKNGRRLVAEGEVLWNESEFRTKCPALLDGAVRGESRSNIDRYFVQLSEAYLSA